MPKASSKPNSYASLLTMPALARQVPGEPEQTDELELQPEMQAETAAPQPVSTSAEPPATPAAPIVEPVFAPAPAASAPVVSPVSAKSIREKRTTRIDPGVYDAVERELKRQKRTRQRASSTLSDLLDELLRNWLNTHGARIE